MCDLFIPCIGGAKDLTHKSHPLDMAVALLEKYKISNVAISHGEQGCFVATKQDVNTFITRTPIRQVQNLLNNRHRKKLGYLSPNECLIKK